MELKIGDVVYEQEPKNVFLIEAYFMEGDADGDQTIEFKIDKKKYDEDENFKSDVHRLIKMLNEGNKRDSKGRRGYDHVSHMLKEEYSDMDFERFVDCGSDEEVEMTPYPELIFNFPSDSSYYLCSFQGVEISYNDEDGITHDVTIEN